MSRPWIQRVIVLLAGVTMNFVLAFSIFFTLFMVGASPITVNPISAAPTGSYFIPSFQEAIDMGYIQYDGIELSALSGSVAAAAGIGTGELILAVDGQAIQTPEEFVSIVSRDQSITLSLQHE